MAATSQHYTRTKPFSIRFMHGVALVLRHLFLLLLCLFAVAPLLWATGTAFKPQTEVFTNTGLLPHEPTLANFVYVLSQTRFALWFGNTLMLATATTLLALVVGTLAGYALSRYRFWGWGLYGNTMLIVQMFPGVMLGIPLFLIFTRLLLVDTLWALLITYMTFALAFSVWMLKGYFDGRSEEHTS